MDISPGEIPLTVKFINKSSGHRVPSLLPLSFHSKRPKKRRRGNNAISVFAVDKFIIESPILFVNRFLLYFYKKMKFYISKLANKYDNYGINNKLGLVCARKIKKLANFY